MTFSFGNHSTLSPSYRSPCPSIADDIIEGILLLLCLCHHCPTFTDIVQSREFLPGKEIGATKGEDLRLVVVVVMMMMMIRIGVLSRLCTYLSW